MNRSPGTPLLTVGTQRGCGLLNKELRVRTILTHSILASPQGPKTVNRTLRKLKGGTDLFRCPFLFSVGGSISAYSRCLRQILQCHFPTAPPPCLYFFRLFCPQPVEKGMLLGRVGRASFYFKETWDLRGVLLGTRDFLHSSQAAALFSWKMLYSLQSQVIPENDSFEINTEEWDLFIISRWDCAALKAVEIILLCQDHTSVIFLKERKFFHWKVEIELIKNPNWVKFCWF